MDAWLLPKSVLIGLAVAAPVGPMGLLCIQRTLARGQWAGLALGAGIACADFTFAVVAAFGVTAVTAALLAAVSWIKLGGSLLLICLGVKIALTGPAGSASREVPGGNARAFAAAYGLTLTNVPTILFFAGIFAAVGSVGSVGSFGSVAESALFSGGVWLGSMGWWLILTTVVQRGAARLKPRFMVRLNRLSGAALVGMALYALATLRFA